MALWLAPLPRLCEEVGSIQASLFTIQPVILFSSISFICPYKKDMKNAQLFFLDHQITWKNI